MNSVGYAVRTFIASMVRIAYPTKLPIRLRTRLKGLHHLEAFHGELVKESDFENTTYQFTLEDGSVVELKGNEEVEYDGEIHSAANLFDALKEGNYGKF